jgi:adenine-specific DNA-methyltransferase
MLRETTAMRISKISACAELDVLECHVKSAPPVSPHATLLEPSQRPYMVLESTERREGDAGVWRCVFAYRPLGRDEWEQRRAGEASRPQLMIDRHSARQLLHEVGSAAPVEAVEAMARSLKRFTRRGDLDVYLVPGLRERLERCWASLPEASAPGMPAILGELTGALAEAEARLLELWEAPRPVVDFAWEGGETGLRPFAVACFGDNADVLGALRCGLGGRVASVYIDPPYDTGTKEFRYGDRYGADRWLSMMDLRLRRLRALMSPASSIHTSINESRVFELKLLGDEVFGASNYLGMTTVRVRHDDRILKGHKALHEVTDFLVGFRGGEAHQPGQRPTAAKLGDYCWRLEVRGAPAECSVRGGKTVERYDPGSFSLVKVPADAEATGLLKRINIRGALRESNSSGRFFTKHLQGDFSPHAGALFRVLGMGGDGLGYRDFVMPPATSGRRNPDYLQGPPVQRARGAGRPFPSLVDFERDFNQVHREGGVEFRNGKKPLALLRHVLTLQGIPAREDAVVVDCFAGSGSLASAVEELDAADGGARCCVLVESGPWFEDVLLQRLHHRMREYERAAARGYVRLRFALFEDVLDHIVWEEDLEEARSQEHGGPLAVLRGRSDGDLHWADPGMSTVPHVMCLREVSGGGMERRTIDRGVFAALRYGADPTVAQGPTSVQARRGLVTDALGESALAMDFYAAMRGASRVNISGLD